MELFIYTFEELPEMSVAEIETTLDEVYSYIWLLILRILKIQISRLHTCFFFFRDMVLVVRFYLRKQLMPDNPVGEPSEDDDSLLNPSTLDNETLVAWGMLPLMVVRHSEEKVNVGNHVIQLYEPPVPDADAMPLEEHWTPKQWRRYILFFFNYT